RCRACRSTRFEAAPNSLVLCLKRFGTGRFGKINKVLVYGEQLDLSPYMAEQAMDEGPATYTLSGVIVHLDQAAAAAAAAAAAVQMNSTSFGHYVCFVRTADGRWYICDDARVAATSPSRVLSQNAYMLFYQRDTPKPAPQPGYKRERPLTPAAAAAAVIHQQQQEAVAVNGTAEAAEQQQEAAVVLQQQQELPPLATEHLARVSTAPAALVRMADELGSSSSKGEEDTTASLASSSSGGAAGDGAETSGCSTPSAAAAGRDDAAATSARASWQQQQQQQRARQQQQQQQQQPDGSAAGSTAAGGGGGLPAVVHSLTRIGPQLLQLRADLPGVQQASEVCVDVVNAGPQLQRLLLKVPGRFAPLEVPLLPMLGAAAAELPDGSAAADAEPASTLYSTAAAAAAAGAQVVAAVSGKLYKRRQVLSLKLHLVAAGSASSSSERSSSGDAMVHWHSTDSGPDVASSSGSESDSSLVLVPLRSIRSVMSEMDLSSFFGRHSSAGQQAMQGLRHGRQQQQGIAAAAAAAAAGQNGAEGGGAAEDGGGGGAVGGGGKKQAGGKKGSSSKKGSKGKKKR
ncbi:hypothetical protein COO60DRAFT_1686733, partial [Scenedesmus sp. NREL 46B-D3]